MDYSRIIANLEIIKHAKEDVHAKTQDVIDLSNYPELEKSRTVDIDATLSRHGIKPRIDESLLLKRHARHALKTGDYPTLVKCGKYLEQLQNVRLTYLMIKDSGVTAVGIKDIDQVIEDLEQQMKAPQATQA